MHKQVCLFAVHVCPTHKLFVVTTPLEELLMFGLIILESLQITSHESKPVEKSKYYHRCGIIRSLRILDKLRQETT